MLFRYKIAAPQFTAAIDVGGDNVIHDAGGALKVFKFTDFTNFMVFAGKQRWTVRRLPNPPT